MKPVRLSDVPSTLFKSLSNCFTGYHIITCNAKGRFGPTQNQCDRAYNNTKVKVKVLHETGLSGVQKWITPSDGFYT